MQKTTENVNSSTASTTVFSTVNVCETINLSCRNIQFVPCRQISLFLSSLTINNQSTLLTTLYSESLYLLTVHPLFTVANFAADLKLIIQRKTVQSQRSKNARIFFVIINICHCQTTNLSIFCSIVIVSLFYLFFKL